MIRPRLIALSDTTHMPEQLMIERMERVAALAEQGTVMLELRDRELADRQRIALGRRLRDAARRHGQLFAVNDRADLAVLLDADALHLGEASITPADARKIVGGLWISRACHDPAIAEPAGADAIVLSPILAARKGRPAWGVGALGVARRALGSGKLLYALGGIDSAGAASCLAAGADGVAVIGGVLDHADALPLLRALGTAR